MIGGLRTWTMRAAACVAFACLPCGFVQAQVPAPSTPPRIELSIFGGVLGGADLGETRADMLTNEVPTSGQTALFRTQTRIDAAPFVEGRVGIGLTRSLWIEGGASYARPDFAVDISGDVEGAPAVTATSRLTQVIADVALQRRWPGRRVTPFVMAGGGYLRQLDDQRATAHTGAVFYGGGGVRIAFTRHLALRGDARVVWLRDGVVLDDQRGPTFSASAGISVGLP